jgi:5'-nucleotidase
MLKSQNPPLENTSSPLTVLLTNDDGIDAEGLAALVRAFSSHDVELWVVAPDSERSGFSHGMSLDRPIHAKKHGKRRYSTSGTVADGVYFALFHLMRRPPDIVVSGINRGANLGSDVIYSGTVAGAREACIRGIHGLSASLVSGDEYDAVATSVVDIALAMVALSTEDALLINLNYPAPVFAPIVLAPLGRRHYPEQVEQRHTPMGQKPYYWLGGPPVKDARVPDSDGDLIARGHATMTPLLLDQTDQTRLRDPLLAGLLRDR